MSEDGRITFVGRIKEMINFKGFKVAPLEIENILNTHPDVEEAQVCFLKYEVVPAVHEYAPNLLRGLDLSCFVKKCP